MSICRYVLVTPDNNELDEEYDSYPDALEQAQKLGYAIVERTYRYEDSELVWTPNGVSTWPPEEK